MDHQRLDTFLWHARLASQRSACAELAASGLVRINRVATDKPHAKVRIGDILTVPLRPKVSVVRVVKLSERRGKPAQARELYEELTAV
jgi:ribosome-associated heat shock protein Hsp15